VLPGLSLWVQSSHQAVVLLWLDIFLLDGENIR